ncbi:PepSY domain-containing protein [Parahaliea maris]|uniref:PepSY domain-containing protein n=1 Tax=Parahaliea maris TaxID=2716870 RepID=A0A5C8ZQL0_9GAMM|nr:PepSY domain-containing protein [Parahaliea maris]TXS90728.1 PepSY domain-containing protein [Parahaliea maris]
MLPTRYLSSFAALLLTVAIGSTLGAPEAAAQRGKSQGQQGQAQQSGSLSPQQAAARAQSRHGGKVLKVTRKGKGYSVRLLLDNGRVITVNVKD